MCPPRQLRNFRRGPDLGTRNFWTDQRDREGPTLKRDPGHPGRVPDLKVQPKPRNRDHAPRGTDGPETPHRRLSPKGQLKWTISPRPGCIIKEGPKGLEERPGVLPVRENGKVVPELVHCSHRCVLRYTRRSSLVNP